MAAVPQEGNTATTEPTGTTIPVRLLHESDVDTWGGPDRVYYEFVVISVLLGLVGGDHIYLRSFKTAGLKALVNLFTFGSWYWWDLIQIFTKGDTVKSEGLSSPLDWIRNIGRGVFVDKNKDPIEYVSQKSYIVYALCAIFLGFVAGDKFYMGDYVSGIAKAVLCLNIFTFLIGWIWAAHDAWNAVFSEQDILDHGIPVAPGIGWFLPNVSSEAFKLRPKREGDNAIVASVLETVGLSEDSGFGPWIRWILCFLGLSSGPKDTCIKPTYRAPLPAAPSANPVPATSVAVNTASTNATPATSVAVNTASTNAAPATSVAVNTVSTNAARANAAPVAETPTVNLVNKKNKANKANNANKANTASPESQPSVLTNTESATPVQPAASEETQAKTRATPSQRGGGRDETVGNSTSNEISGPGPVVAGALTAVVIAAGLKSTYEFISQQYQ